MSDDFPSESEGNEPLVSAPSWYGQTVSESSGISNLRSALENNSDILRERTCVAGYKLADILGCGGMGTVYRAQSSDGEAVAIKVLRPDLMKDRDALQRFAKEGRLLEDAANPYVVRLLDVGCNEDCQYLVMELVDGISLREVLAKHRTLPVSLSLEIISHVARGLSEMHRKGIVHRDVKPANILIRSDILESIENHGSLSLANQFSESKLVAGAVKITDLGLARHLVQTQSHEVTRTNALLGTPQYMAPESCDNRQPGAAADVYAMGATLYEMISGKPPFQSESVWDLVDKHRHHRPLELSEQDSHISEGVSRVVSRTLEKDPAARYRDARELLDDILRLQRGQPTSIQSHPKLPDSSSRERCDYVLTCKLASSPEQLWPYISDTGRINRAVGLPAVRFTIDTSDAGEIRHQANVQFVGLPMRWREYPFEWIETRKMAVLREFVSGPFKWVTSTVELHRRADGGTDLVHRFTVQPSGLFGCLIAAAKVGWKTRRAFNRIYHRIDSVLTGTSGAGALVDHFEDAKPLSAVDQKTLQVAVERLRRRDVSSELLLNLSDYLSQSPPQAVARIRPIVLADRLGFPQREVIEACLHAAHVGLLRLRWDIHCPICRVPVSQVETLSEVQTHGRCDVCNHDFKTDFAHSVELVFSTEAEVRESDQQTYCIGGPAHLPHVVAQIRLAPREQYSLGLSLCAGEYCVRSPQLARQVGLRVSESGESKEVHIDLGSDVKECERPALCDRAQRLTFTNRSSCELLVRVERVAECKDLLRASDVGSQALFRQLFPRELLADNAPIALPRMIFVLSELVTDVIDDDQPCPPASAEPYAHIQRAVTEIGDHVVEAGGIVVKTFSDFVLAAFDDPVEAVEAALKIADHRLAGFRFRSAIHLGPAVMATLNNQVDYFGPTVQELLALPQNAAPGSVVLSDRVMADDTVTNCLETLVSAQRAEELNGTEGQVHLFRPLGDVKSR